MPNDREAELKQVKADSKSDRPPPKRDQSMTGGERAETPLEREERVREKSKPKEPPIIESDVT
jgi:hypothetical protein